MIRFDATLSPRDFDKRFERDFNRAVAEAMRAGLRAAVTVMADAADAEAPEDTGELRRSRSAPRVGTRSASVRWLVPYARATLAREHWIGRAFRKRGSAARKRGVESFRQVFARRMRR